MNFCEISKIFFFFTEELWTTASAFCQRTRISCIYFFKVYIYRQVCIYGFLMTSGKVEQPKIEVVSSF